jgi:hypothetical protein
VPVRDSDMEFRLSWLADAPVFIDGQQIGAFYDAVVGPAFRLVQAQVSRGETENRERSLGGRVGGSLTALFPWLKIDSQVDATRTAASGVQAGGSLTLQPAESPTRQLVELCLHYLVNQPERIRLVAQDGSLPPPQEIAGSPRMITFVDAGQGAKFLPQAAELNDGRAVTFFGPLVEKLKRDGEVLPVAYPDTDSPDRERQRDLYWGWF